MAPLSVVICDDNVVFGDALSEFLQENADIEVRAVTVTGEAAVAALDHSVDLLIVDAVLSGHSGIDVVEAVRLRRLPCRILVLSGYVTVPLVVSALESGANGVATKGISATALLGVVQAAAARETVIPEELTPSVLSQLHVRRDTRAEAARLYANLTTRERRVLRDIERGLSTEAIAERAEVSPAAARSVIRTALQKIGPANRLQAAALVRMFDDVGFQPDRVPAKPARHSPVTAH